MARLFILRPKQVTMPSIGVLPSNYTTLRCMHYAELFLQSHGLPNWNESRWSTVSSASPLTSQESQSMLHYFFSLTVYLTRITVDAALFLQLHPLPHKNHSRCCTISSASPHISWCTFSIASKATGMEYYWLLSINIDPPVCHSLNHSHRAHYISELGSGLY